MSVEEDSLQHYGVLGMKWGVRKDRGAKRSTKSRGSSGSSGSRVSTRSGGRRYKAPAESLSTSELRRRINRIKLEREYTELSASNLKNALSAVERTVYKLGNKTVDTAMNKTVNETAAVITPILTGMVLAKIKRGA